MTTHRYAVRLTWAGSTGLGYEGYERTHELVLGDTVLRTDGGALRISADPAFRGDPALPNPELLLLAAAASCQLLAFLAVAARARVDVVAYADEAVAFMPEDDPPMRVTRVELAPRVSVRGEQAAAKVPRLLEVAHRECFIANSLRSQIVISPEVSLAH